MKTALLQAASELERKCETPDRDERRLFILLNDWTWWVWAVTATLLATGLRGFSGAFVAGMGLTIAQTIVIFIREKSWLAFPVQLRIAYLALLAIGFPPAMRWLYWVPTIGTFALVTFGYCLMVRLISLLPWNRKEPLSFDLVVRTFVSRPSLARVAKPERGAGCAGGLCTIEAQVRTRSLGSTI